MKKLGLIFLLAILTIGESWGQDSVSRGFDEDRLSEQSTDRAFNYGLEPIPENQSIEDEDSSGWTWWRYILYGSLFLGIGILIFVFVRRTLVHSPSHRYTQPKDHDLSNPKDIHQLDFSQVISQAEKEEDYRLAIRLWFLQALKALTERNLINWKPHKTDKEYLNELSEGDRRNRFAQLMRTYEYVWYGGYAPSRGHYQSLSQSYKDFIDKLRYI